MILINDGSLFATMSLWFFTLARVKQHYTLLYWTVSMKHSFIISLIKTPRVYELLIPTIYQDFFYLVKCDSWNVWRKYRNSFLFDSAHQVVMAVYMYTGGESVRPFLCKAQWKFMYPKPKLKVFFGVSCVIYTSPL